MSGSRFVSFLAAVLGLTAAPSLSAALPPAILDYTDKYCSCLSQRRG